MGRHSSDSEDNSRGRRRRHRQRSSSSSSSGSRVTFRSKHSSRRSRSRSRNRNRDRDRRRRHHSSSSSSRGSSHRRRSRSTDRGRNHRSYRSRSRSRNQRSRSHHRRSRSRSSGRSSRKRSRSRDGDRGQHKTREKDRTRDKTKDKKTDKAKDKEKQRETGSIKAGLQHLTSAEQAKARLQLVLQATAKTDEVLKIKENLEEETGKIKEEEEVSLAEQVRRIKDIEAIESDSFVPQAFKSSRDTTKVIEPLEIQKESDTATVKEEVTSLPTSITYNDSNILAHPNLFMDKEEAEMLWLNRLISLRQERLMGSPVP
ncbi:serine/Arginine-related protein 53 [Myxocyprinus asiaticus]|uniref:serine/Arginine-related protein 53 n=1 Tax=Myxocyprinus asiaticus TaxID=70543 RepID=UPI002222249E|nr:serine/Arginine-related protein 53 [Myxocyprinus asiaticus]XP_051535608.1 serine/Arginine-related protein 53 [Myxocyprinus asiaticus]